VQHGLGAQTFRFGNSGGERLAMIVTVRDDADLQVSSFPLSSLRSVSVSYRDPYTRGGCPCQLEANDLETPRI
jgi:hypothetical protein